MSLIDRIAFTPMAPGEFMHSEGLGGGLGAEAPRLMASGRLRKLHMRSQQHCLSRCLISGPVRPVAILISI